MTLINALESLKSKGITQLVGMYEEFNIDKYIENAHHLDEDAQRYAEQDWAQYQMVHADDHFIVEVGGHHIIATHYDSHDMATYGDYETDEQLHAAFDEWKIATEAEEIADNMVKERPGELPREMWVQIATNELQKASKEAKMAFERDFHSNQMASSQNNQPGYKEYSDAVQKQDIAPDMKKLMLTHIGRDSRKRPVYECEGRLYVDVDPRSSSAPDICTKLNNEFDGEPDTPIRYIQRYENTEIDFVPHRDLWDNDAKMGQALQTAQIQNHITSMEIG